MGFTLILLSLIVVHTFIPDLPQGDDLVLHLYRSIALDYSIQADHSIYPRYSSGLNLGYGASLFNYFSPLAYYLPVMLYRLGLGIQLAFTASIVCYLWFGGYGVAIFIKQITQSPSSGVIAGTFYLYAPYVLFDAISRGTITELVALSCLPWVVLAIYRLVHHPSRLQFLLTTLAVSIFTPLHNIVTIHSFFLLIPLALVFVSLAKNKRAALQRLTISAGLALGITCFYWYPALGETQYTQINAVTSNLSFVDVSNYLRPVTDIWSAPITADSTQFHAPVPIAFNLMGLVFSGIVFFSKNMLTPLHKRLLLVLGSIFAFSLWMGTSTSSIVWEKVPLLNYTQFAWRILGVTTIALSFMVGIASAYLTKTTSALTQYLIQSVFVIGLMLYAVPWLYRPSLHIDDLSIQQIQAYERTTGQRALSSYSEYLPIWFQSANIQDKLQGRFEVSDIVYRLSADQTNLQSAIWSGTSAIITIDTVKDSILVLDWAYMPGWSATLNQKPIPVFPDPQTGLVSLHVPKGLATIHIEMRGTEQQNNANLISLLSFIGLLAITSTARFQPTPQQYSETQFEGKQMVYLSSLGIAMLVLKVIVIDQGNTVFLFNQYDGASQNLKRVENFASDTWKPQIKLLGSNIPDVTLSGTTLEFEVYWTTQIPQTADFSAVYILRDHLGNLVTQQNSFTPGDIATSNWRVGFYLIDTVKLEIPAHLAPNDYQLEARLYDSQTQQIIDLVHSDGTPKGISTWLDSVKIQAPSQAFSSPSISPIGSLAKLVNISELPARVSTGDAFHWSWTWLPGSSDAIPQAQWLWMQNGISLAQSIPFPIMHDVSIKTWQAGQALLGYHNSFIPADLDTGRYDLALMISDTHTTHSELLPIASMEVIAPERNYTFPSLDVATDAIWDNGITLLGYRLNRQSEAITLQAYWQTQKPLLENLHLFVHVVDEQGRIVWQEDGVPVSWQRPVTGWTQDEIIETTYVIPENLFQQHQIKLGWYNPITTQRITLSALNADVFILESK